jgi:cell pole-organizing protein PopZ
MSAENAQREPTMEEILASIRRIISEEDKPAEGGGDVLDLQPPAPPPVVEAKTPITPPKPATAPRPAPAPAPAPEPVAIKPPPPPIDMFDEPEEPARPSPLPEEELLIVERQPEPTPPPVVAAPKPAPQPERTPPPPQRPLVSDPVASQAAGALGRLMGSMMVSTGNTLDDVVRELLKPMLKEWLDANLTQIVEAEVAKEIDRIHRMSR